MRGLDGGHGVWQRGFTEQPQNGEPVRSMGDEFVTVIFTDDGNNNNDGFATEKETTRRLIILV